VEAETHTSGTSLSRYLDGLGAYLDRQRKQGLKGIKFLSAYSRDLRFDPVDVATAERVFNRIADESCGLRPSVLGYEETRPLQDHIVHRLTEIAGDLGLTAVLHTGIQAGNYNDLDNARPRLLWNMFHRYPKVRFNLLHAGPPFVGEAGLLAKYFPNATVDMAWVHAISPEISIRALHDWVDLLPRNKILGFGGDYQGVEKVYGHLVLAQENIATALTAKVERGAMGRQEARAWISALLWENPRGGYALDRRATCRPRRQITPAGQLRDVYVDRCRRLLSWFPRVQPPWLRVERLPVLHHGHSVLVQGGVRAETDRTSACLVSRANSGTAR